MAMGRVAKGPVPARIDGILAREANVAAVFRRGPSKSTQLLRWDLETDEVVPGQWIGGRVYTRRCDLSPDGALLVGAFTNYSRSRPGALAAANEPQPCGWTAVSRPPYFTALAVWRAWESWNLGGLWKGPRDLRLNLARSQSLDEAEPSALTVAPLGLPTSEDEPIFSMRLERAGWRTVRALEVGERNPEWRENYARLRDALESGLAADPSGYGEIARLMQNTTPEFTTVAEGEMERTFPGGRLTRTMRHSGDAWSIRDGGDAVRRTFETPTFGTRWLDVDRRGRVIFGDEGALWAWAGFPDGAPTMVADLNENRFEPVAPPEWALAWPGD